MSTPQMYNELYQHVQTWAGMLGAEDGDDIINHIYERITAGIAEAIEERDRFKAALEESVALQSHYCALEKAARALLAACDMDDHNQAISYGKKGKAWNGEFIRKSRIEAMARVRALTPF